LILIVEIINVAILVLYIKLSDQITLPPNALLIESISKVGDVVLIVMLFILLVDVFEFELFTVLEPFKLNVSAKKLPIPPKNPLTLSAAFDAKSLMPSVTLLAMLEMPSVTPENVSFIFHPKSPIFDGKSPIHSNIF